MSLPDRRREYITGFSGSNGDAVVTLSSAALWTDSRYYLQADEQMDCNWLLVKLEGHSVSNFIHNYNHGKELKSILGRRGIFRK